LSDPPADTPADPPADTPADLPAKPKRGKAVRHTTLLGRVVYTRKRHYFKIRDAARILRAVLQTEPGRRASVLEFYRDASDLLIAFAAIWGEYALSGPAKTVSELLAQLIKWFQEELHGKH